MDKPITRILVGLGIAAFVFLILCGTLKAVASPATFSIVNPILLAIVVAGWLWWSFIGHSRKQRQQA